MKLPTSHQIFLTQDAALRVFWRKKSLARFLKQMGVKESFIGTWIDESKREFLDRLFEKMERTENGQRVIHRMACELAKMDAFPDLIGWEDSSEKIQLAKDAVLALKNSIDEQSAQERSESERAAIREARHKNRLKYSSTERKREELLSNLTHLLARQGTQEGGYLFEAWFFELVDYFELESRKPYRAGDRQIDGSITVDGTTYLVELKFTKTPVGAPEIDIFRSKVESKADNTMGVMVSMSGYKETAISGASGRKSPLLLLDNQHVLGCLHGMSHLGEAIKRVRRHASQYGEAYLKLADFGI